MKRILCIAIAMSFIAGAAWAAKTTYIVNNGRMNWVKIKEVGAKDAAAFAMTHPVTLDEAGVRAALASINLSRSYMIKKEVDTQRVFDDASIGYLAPALVRAFSQASANEIVVFSYLSKNPLFILRNDRLNICDAWVSGNELHIRFQKLYAKVSGDTDKRGNEAKLIAQSRGLRVALEMGEGQKMGVDDPSEVVLSLNYNYVKKPEPDKPITEGVTMTGERVPLEGAAEAAAATPAPEAKASTKKGKKAKEEAMAAQAPAPAPAPASAKSPKERLEQLNQLKKDGLINQKEFDAKKQEILNQL